jgi:hypothetical protein
VERRLGAKRVSGCRCRERDAPSAALIGLKINVVAQCPDTNERLEGRLPGAQHPGKAFGVCADWKNKVLTINVLDFDFNFSYLNFSRYVI